jgi:carbon-monoxide dehydrogenase large subunit
MAESAVAATRFVIGDSPRRREDARFVTGSGQYLDDVTFSGVAHAVFLRSPHAHARITDIDVGDASHAPGVLAILTAKEAAADGLHPLSRPR